MRPMTVWLLLITLGVVICVIITMRVCVRVANNLTSQFSCNKDADGISSQSTTETETGTGHHWIIVES